MKAILKTLTISERRACAIAKCNRRTFRYKSHRITDDAPLRKRLEELAAERRRFGYRRLAVLLQREGIVVNLKRIRRVYSEANLQVRRRIRRRLALGRGNLAVAASSMNERWSLDFVHDTLSSKRRVRALTIVDDFTHESLAIEVDTALSGERVSRVLDAIAAARGYPATIVLDNGPELTSLTMLRWPSERRVRLHHIAPGKPTQNAFIESFNGKFRDECLNENDFSNLAEARRITEAWRQDYNRFRPHSSLGNQTPEEFVTKLLKQLPSPLLVG